MPKSQLLFSAVFGFRNPTKEIFSELDEINAQGLIFPRSFQKTEGVTKWATRRRHHDTRTTRVRWEPQEEGVMRTSTSFPSVRNQGLSNQ